MQSSENVTYKWQVEFLLCFFLLFVSLFFTDFQVLVMGLTAISFANQREKLESELTVSFCV